VAQEFRDDEVRGVRFWIAVELSDFTRALGIVEEALAARSTGAAEWAFLAVLYAHIEQGQKARDCRDKAVKWQEQNEATENMQMQRILQGLYRELEALEGDFKNEATGSR
jgi:hypothetical protein